MTSRNISRAACEAQMDAKAAPMTTFSRLDFYHELYQSNFRCMLAGLPYSKHAMNAALDAILSMAIDDEMHQRFGELPQPITDAIEEEQRNDTEWLGASEQAALAYGPHPLTHSHLPVKVLPYARWFRHGGDHPLADEETAYTWCTGCGEILSLNNDAARAAMPEF